MSILTPSALLDNPTIPTDLEALRTLLMMQRLLGYETEVVVAPSQTIPASSNGDFTVQPPDAAQEWLILATQLAITTAVDNADNVLLDYQDIISGFNFNLFVATRGSLINDTATVPNNDTSPNQRHATFPSTPLIVKLKANGEGWKSARWRITTTSTVGNRVVTARTLYIPRQRLKL
jgi:hypothetical protein